MQMQNAWEWLHITSTLSDSRCPLALFSMADSSAYRYAMNNNVACRCILGRRQAKLWCWRLTPCGRPPLPSPCGCAHEYFSLLLQLLWSSDIPGASLGRIVQVLTALPWLLRYCLHARSAFAKRCQHNQRSCASQCALQAALNPKCATAQRHQHDHLICSCTSGPAAAGAPATAGQHRRHLLDHQAAVQARLRQGACLLAYSFAPADHALRCPRCLGQTATRSLRTMFNS